MVKIILTVADDRCILGTRNIYNARHIDICSSYNQQLTIFYVLMAANTISTMNQTSDILGTSLLVLTQMTFTLGLMMNSHHLMIELKGN